jgi:hypothetical protein
MRVPANRDWDIARSFVQIWGGGGGASRCQSRVPRVRIFSAKEVEDSTGASGWWPKHPWPRSTCICGDNVRELDRRWIDT